MNWMGRGVNKKRESNIILKFLVQPLVDSRCCDAGAEKELFPLGGKQALPLEDSQLEMFIRYTRRNIKYTWSQGERSGLQPEGEQEPGVSISGSAGAHSGSET